MTDFTYKSTVSDEQFNKALVDLERIIARKDTAKEWASFAGRTLLAIGKIAITQVGFGPAIKLFEELFEGEDEILTILRLLGELQKNED